MATEMSPETTGVTLELCLRTVAPPEAQDRQADLQARMLDLVATGAVDDATVTWWGRRACAPTAEGENPACPEAVVEMVRAADAAGVSLEPFLTTHEAVHEGMPDVLFLPVIALLVRVDGDLRGIYPLVRDGERATVADGLAAVAAGRDATNLD